MNTTHKDSNQVALTHRSAVIIDAEGTEITSILLERAETLEQINKGLMGRESLGPNEGMVFILPYVCSPSFWMKDTPLSLDILFLNGNGRINTIHHFVKPLRDDLSYYPNVPSSFVVELNAGFCERYGVTEGCLIKPTE